MIKRLQSKGQQQLTRQSQNELLNEARQSFLKKLKGQKDHEQIEQFMLTLNFIQKLKSQYGPLIVADLCKNLSYIRVPAGTQIIQINRENRTFYVILAGKVSISIYVQKGNKRNSINPQINNTLSINQISENNNQQQYQQIQQLQLPQSNSQPQFQLQSQTSLRIDEEQLILQEIKTLQQGDSFGELALIKDNLKATATVTTKTDCEFGFLTRKQYLDILGNISKNLHHEKLQFLQQIPLIQQWIDEDQRQLSYYLVLKNYSRNEIAVKEGKDNSQIFIVKYGVFHITKTFQNQCFIISELQESEIFFQDVQEPQYCFSLKCASDGSSLYEFSHYDFKKFAENNNYQEIQNFMKQKQNYRINKYQERVNYMKDVKHQEQDLIDTRIEFKKTMKLYSDLKIKCNQNNIKKFNINQEENKIDKQRKVAQQALKRFIIPRFNHCDDCQNQYTLPAVRKISEHKTIKIDLIEAEKSFESLNSYQIGNHEKYQLYYENLPIQQKKEHSLQERTYFDLEPQSWKQYQRYLTMNKQELYKNYQPHSWREQK